MINVNFEQLLQFFKVLGNKNRLKILGLLANQERNVGDLARLLDLKEPTISHHLAMMKELGLVQVRAEGNERIYWLDSKRLEQMNKDIFSQGGLAQLVENGPAESEDDRILRAFVKDGRLLEIPARRKKQLVVLRWLVQKFERGTQYPEKELNAILKQYHPDNASLRRYLVDEGLMQREKGIYWRTDEGDGDDQSQ